MSNDHEAALWTQPGVTVEDAERMVAALWRKYRERAIRAGAQTGKSHAAVRLRRRVPSHDGWLLDAAERLAGFLGRSLREPRPSVALALLGAA